MNSLYLLTESCLPPTLHIAWSSALSWGAKENSDIIFIYTYLLSIYYFILFSPSKVSGLESIYFSTLVNQSSLSAVKTYVYIKETQKSNQLQDIDQSRLQSDSRLLPCLSPCIGPDSTKQGWEKNHLFVSPGSKNQTLWNMLISYHL